MMTLLFALIFTLLSPPAPPDGAYALTLLPGPQVSVSLQSVGDSDGVTDFEVQPHWGGIENTGDDVTSLAITDSKGGPLAVEHPSATRWTVKHTPFDRLNLTYIIPARDLPPLLRGNDYRTKLSPGFFHMIGELGLILPKHFDNETSRSFTFRFQGFENDGQSITSSFGNGPGPFTLARSGQNIRHTVILAGKFRTLLRTIKSNTVGIAIVGDNWGFDDDAFADMTAKIISAERDFWNDHTDPWFLVTLTPTCSVADSRSFSLGGTGLTDSFALFCNTGLTLEAGSPHALQVKVLLAHEYFHTWNGGKIPSAGEEGVGYWFSEGFTDFYARRMLHHAGMISDSEFLNHLNQVLNQAAGNPSRNAPASLINAEFWKNQQVQKLPYQRGDQVALAVDERIREKSRGSRSLDDLMKDLLDRMRKGEAYSSDLVVNLIESDTDAEFAAAIRRSVIDGADVPLPPSITIPPATLSKRQSRSFDSGFDVDASRTTKVISGVRTNTSAHSSGLRDGQKLKGLSISSGTPDSPPFAKVTIDEDGKPKELIYDPLTPPIEVPQYVAENSR